MRLISSEEDRNRKYLWEQNISIKYPKHIQEKLCAILTKRRKSVLDKNEYHLHIMFSNPITNINLVFCSKYIFTRKEVFG